VHKWGCSTCIGFWLIVATLAILFLDVHFWTIMKGGQRG
jgi:hypothetical protein